MLCWIHQRGFSYHLELRLVMGDVRVRAGSHIELL